MAIRFDDVDLMRDRTLVERFQEGDGRAFDELYLRYSERLLRFCVRRVGDRHEAEEITQEAFARAFRSLATFEGERRFYPWLTVIAGRLCIDHHRRKARTEPQAEVDSGTTENAGELAVVRAVDFELLTAAMERISERHREVLNLREHEGWSNKQIADRYGVAVGSVEALVFRARQALRREFLAVAGPDRGWAALPFLGFAMRRYYAMRGRLEQALSQASPLTMGVASVALVAGSVVGLAPHGGSAGSATPDDRVPQAAAATTAAASAASPPATGVTEVPSSPVGGPATPLSADATTASAAAAPASPPQAIAPVDVDGAAVVSADEGKRQGQGHELQADVGVAGASIDPNRFVEIIGEDIGGFVAGGGR